MIIKIAAPSKDIKRYVDIRPTSPITNVKQIVRMLVKQKWSTEDGTLVLMLGREEGIVSDDLFALDLYGVLKSAYRSTLAAMMAEASLTVVNENGKEFVIREIISYEEEGKPARYVETGSEEGRLSALRYLEHVIPGHIAPRMRELALLHGEDPWRLVGILVERIEAIATDILSAPAKVEEKRAA